MTLMRWRVELKRDITEYVRTFEQHAAKKTEESRRYDRLMEHVVYKGLQQC